MSVMIRAQIAINLIQIALTCLTGKQTKLFEASELSIDRTYIPFNYNHKTLSFCLDKQVGLDTHKGLTLDNTQHIGSGVKN